MAENVIKPKVVLFGGCGFIGRNIVEYLITNELVSGLRIVDKVPPQIAYLNKKHQEVFENPLVEFKSANLIIKGAAEASLAEGVFDIAINCAGEARAGQAELLYEEGVYGVSMSVARAAAAHPVDRLVEISSAQLDSNDKTELKETDPAKPWTNIAKFKLQVENDLKNIAGLKYTIIRPAIVYGIGDKTGIVPRLVLGRVYQHLGETMKLLWSRDLALNTVHVHDVARAVWHVARREESVGQLYHLADEGRTTQGAITDIVADIFAINCDYYGNILSSVCKGDVADEANDKHLGPWAWVCRANGVTDTPLTPYVERESLDKRHLSVNADKMRATGFELCHPVITRQLLQEVIDDYVEMKLFPPLKSS